VDQPNTEVEITRVPPPPASMYVELPVLHFTTGKFLNSNHSMPRCRSRHGVSTTSGAHHCPPLEVRLATGQDKLDAAAHDTVYHLRLGRAVDPPLEVRLATGQDKLDAAADDTV